MRVWQNEFTKIMTNKLTNPLTEYPRVWEYQKQGLLEKEVWDNFCFVCLKRLLDDNKNILDKLK